MTTRRVIIDTDPGIDDAQAILFAFLSGQFDIEALTTVFGNVPVELSALNALRLVELAVRPAVPVYVGAAQPLVPRRLHSAPEVAGATGFGHRAWPLPTLTATAGEPPG